MEQVKEKLLSLDYICAGAATWEQELIRAEGAWRGAVRAFYTLMEMMIVSAWKEAWETSDA